MGLDLGYTNGQTPLDKIYKLPVFSWGTENLVKQSDTRTNYIKAVKEADKNNYGQLLSFARS